MSVKEKPGKSAQATPEELEQKLISSKEKFQAAKDALISFNKSNGLKKDEDASNHEDEKIAKKWKKLKADMTESASRVKKYEELFKASRKKNVAPKPAKYNYPAEVTTGEDKKKYRQVVRQKAKKLSITVDEYLVNPDKFDKAYNALPVKEPVNNLKAAQDAKRKKKEEREAAEAAPETKKTKKVEVTEEKPKKKKKKATPEETED